MTREKGLILVCPTWAEGVRILRLLVRKEVPMLDTSDPKEWSHPDKIGKDHDCPSCGYHGGGHVTVFVGPQMGRRCLECGSTWPIEIPQS